MGNSSSNSPEYGFRPFSELPPVPPVRSRPPRRWRHVVLFLLTVASTLIVGADHFASFYGDFGTRTLDLSGPTSLLNGLWYSASILAILGAHEFGHYYACRYYGVDASLPYFLPAPLPLTGTLGAFIRIRQTIPSKRELFDIGIAGPIAGFMVAVPVLLVGMGLSRVTALPGDTSGFVELGEPLLFKAVAWLYWGTPPDGYSINMHPMAFAAWFGMLATALNLFPIGQLDGGHISYAVLGRKSTIVTLGDGGGAHRADVRIDVVARLDRTDRRDAADVRTAAPANDRRTRSAGQRTSVARPLRARHVRRLLHAGADRAARPRRKTASALHPESQLQRYGEVSP